MIEPCKIPMVLENDEMAIRAALKTCTGIDRNKVRMVMIRNTQELETILVSESLAGEGILPEGAEILGGAEAMSFDQDGNLSE